tara:strand:+ start:183 stop:1241 length:1059 start_codon:yes stop_codon:yes gene_type:complete
VKSILTLSFLIWFSDFICAQVEHHTINVGGLEGTAREYYLYMPEDVDLNTSLIFVLHGYSGSASGIMGYSELNDLADEHNFIACYPQGTIDDDGYSFWNVGYSFHSNVEVNDIEFIRTLATHITQEYRLTNFNIFSTGMSNGGDMSYLLACQASDVIRAIAPVAGCMMEWIFDSCNPEYPRPVFEIHGTDDDVTWWDGDYDDSGGWGNYIGVMPALSFWTSKNSCTDFESNELPDLDPSDGSYVISDRYSNGIGGNEVWLYKVINGGHDWPGSYGNMDINSSLEALNFFSRFKIQSTVGDTNFDGTSDIRDLLDIVDQIIDQDSYNAISDINQDGIVNGNDMFHLATTIIGY